VPDHADTSVTIVGAGLAGALAACMLARRGYRVNVFERRPDPRAAGFIGGRSINLALSTRGIHALTRVGLDEAVLADAIAMRGRMMHAEQGALTFQPYSRNPDDAINSVSRGGLNVTVLEAAERRDNVTVRFAVRCVDIDPDAGAATFHDEQSGETFVTDGGLIIGADGAFSAVRGALQRTDRFDFGQQYLEHGYKELTIPPTKDGGFAMEPHALHIWPRGGYMMIALPNRDFSFTCTLFWPFEGPHGFAAVQTAEQVIPFFERHFGDAVPLMPTLVDDYMTNPTSSLVTVRCHPWHYGDRVLLLGDAAHAIVPFYGQGMNAGFEDCEVLDTLIEQYGPDWGRVLPRFTELRKANGDAIADMALENFIEMRDKVGSRWFLFKKRGGQILHGLLPGLFVPLYNMVTFSRIPYAEARRRAQRQSTVVRTVLGVTGLLVTIAAIMLIGKAI
jgi:kynurenine 3-monooxygenase